MQVNYEMIKTNTELRWHARNQLTGNWGNAILVVLIFSFVNSAASSILVGPLTVGLSICFINLLRYRRFRIENLFDGFKSFGTSFLAFLLKGLMVFFLSLLLIVPGIIASLAYALTPFIINDNPGITATEALKLSREMMKGFKGKLFSMYFIFFLWCILALCTCGIGFLWLTPYMQATLANFYENLREAYGLPANQNPNMGNYYNMNNNFNNNANYNYNNMNNNFNNNNYNNMNGNYNNNNNMNNNYGNMGNYGNQNPNNNMNNYYNNGENNNNNNNGFNNGNYPSNPPGYNTSNNYTNPLPGNPYNPNTPQNNTDDGIDKF